MAHSTTKPAIPVKMYSKSSIPRLHAGARRRRQEPALSNNSGQGYHHERQIRHKFTYYSR